MKYFLIILGLIPFFLQAQEVTSETSQIIQVDTLYFVETEIIYSNGNEVLTKDLIGDSTDLAELFIRETIKKQRQRAVYNSKALEGYFLGEYAQLLNTFTGKWFYYHSAQRLYQHFIGNYTIKIGETTYNVTCEKPNLLIKLNIETVGEYTLLPLSPLSFLIKDYYGTGEHLEVFLFREYGQKRIFYDQTRSVKITFIPE